MSYFFEWCLYPYTVVFVLTNLLLNRVDKRSGLVDNRWVGWVEYPSTQTKTLYTFCKTQP